MGYIRINRKLFDHIFWKENRIYSRAEAWIDLIQLASFVNNNKRMIDNVMVTWNRGEYPISYRFLSMRWNWSVHKVRIFMKLLLLTKQAARRTARRTTILTLCKYDYYNPISQADVQGEGQADGTKYNKDKEDGVLKENLIKEKIKAKEEYEKWKIKNKTEVENFFNQIDPKENNNQPDF